MRKGLLIAFAVMLAVFTGCQLSDEGDGNSAIVVELAGASPQAMSVLSTIEIDQLPINFAKIEVTDPKGILQVKTWTPGAASTFVFNGKRTGIYSITVTDVDSANNTNTASTNLFVRSGYNYTIKIRLGSVTGGVISDEGLVAYYPFVGNANDWSGNNLHGVNYGGGVTLTNGVIGNANSAYYFNGTGDISTGIGAAFNCGTSPLITNISTAFSVSLWVNSAQTEARSIMGRHANDSSAGWYLFKTANNKIVFMLDAPGAPAWSITNNTAISNNVFYHIAATYNKTTGVACLYVNNVKIERTGLLSVVLPYYTASWNDEPLMIGTFWSGGCNYFRGILDEVFFYNRDLSAMEVEQLYKMYR